MCDAGHCSPGAADEYLELKSGTIMNESPKIENSRLLHLRREYPLFPLVTPDKKDKLVPCHYIPLNNRRTTINKLYAQGSQESLGRLYRSWLKDITQKLRKPS
jgi:hypothetical protein